MNESNQLYACIKRRHMLKGKVAIVTGGSGGIGAAIALELGKEGANVVIDYHSHPDSAEAVQKKIAGLGSGCLTVQADVSKPVDLQKLVNSAVQKFGRLDIWVNN